MGEFPRKSDGRRVFTAEFKRGGLAIPTSEGVPRRALHRSPGRRLPRGACGARR
jgi:hypothetical protein